MDKILERRSEGAFTYDYRKDNKLCVRCGEKLTEDDLLKSNWKWCRDCRSVINIRYKENHAKKNRDKKSEEDMSRDELERRRRAAGLCIICGKVLFDVQDKQRGVCPECQEKHDEMVAAAVERDKQRQAEKSGREDSVLGLINTFEWFRKLVTNKSADGTHIECEGCVWRRQRTETERNSYCPTPSGTSPITHDCLKFMVTSGHCADWKKKNRQGGNE